MPVVFIFLVVFLFTLLPGDTLADHKFPYKPINHHIIAWDEQHREELTHITDAQREFRQKVTHYRSMIDHKLSVEEMSHLIKEANLNQVPPEILIKLLKIESNFNKDIVGPPTRYGHAYGMAQFMENTAPWIAKMADLEYKFEYLFDPLYSITLAATYLNYLQYGDGSSHDGFHDWHASLTAYHRGMGGLSSYQRRHHTTVSRYSSTIINQAEKIALPNESHDNNQLEGSPDSGNVLITEQSTSKKAVAVNNKKTH